MTPFQRLSIAVSLIFFLGNAYIASFFFVPHTAEWIVHILWCGGFIASMQAYADVNAKRPLSEIVYSLFFAANWPLLVLAMLLLKLKKE